jgi:predicted lysophospholipase L1 biosynthesis ABC-type transport system permease subunit
VFPSIDIAGVDPTRLSSGVAMTWGAYQALGANSSDPQVLPDITFLDLADGVDPETIITRYPQGMPERTGTSATEWLPSLAPAEVLETERAKTLIWFVIGFVALVVLAMIAHGLLSTMRRRRGSYAVLKTIGFTRRQVLGTVTTQALVTTLLALIVAVPAGILLGQWSWRLFAHRIGVIDTPVIPVLPITLTGLAALAGALAVGVAPAVRAARTDPARVLRAE